MGLDIFFHKRTYNQHNPNEPISIDEDGEKHYEEMPEIAYFRKVNFLMSFFDYYEKCEDEGNMEGDCCYVPISEDEISALIDACSETIKRRKEIEKAVKEGIDIDDLPLQPESGFFFGSTDYDEWFFEDVKEVKKKFKAILSDLKDDEEVFMYAWW